MSTHTPGPWVWEGRPWVRKGLAAANGHDVLMAAEYAGSAWIEAKEADAALIAAAPDLLAFAREYMGTWVAAGAMALDDDALRDMCRAAIAKAEGRE